MTTYPPVPEPTEPERQRSDQPESSAEPARPAWDRTEPEPPSDPAREQGPGKSQPPEPGPDDPDPVAPNESPSSEPEPFSGNPAPDGQDPDPERDPGGLPSDEPVPDARTAGATPMETASDAAAPAATAPDATVTGAATPGGAPAEPPSSMPPPAVPQPAAPDPPPASAGYDPYSAGATPPPGGGHDAPAHGGRGRNGLGTAALVCGVIALVLSLIPGVHLFTWPLGVLAIAFGAVGWARANRGEATNKTIAITGLVLGIVSFLTMCLIWAIISPSVG